jgi:hypothetical protein
MNAACGDGYVEADVEECDGNVNVGAHQRCDNNCQLEDLTYCGDGTRQSPNQEHEDGPHDNGFEECDGNDGVGDYQHCSSSCVLVQETYCGDGIRQNPNYQGEDEQCDYGSENGGDFCTTHCEKIIPLFRKFTIKNTDFNSFDMYREYLHKIWPRPTDVNSITFSGNSHLTPIVRYNAVGVSVPADWTGSEIVDFTSTNKVGDTVQMKINFTVINTPDYGMTGQQTRLLVSKGLLVSDYYLDSLTGNLDVWGPYDITVKVWEIR